MEDKLEIALKNLREIEAWLARMYEEASSEGHVHLAESRLRDSMFLLRHAIDQIELWRKAGP
ncbi:MAG: hypothetical protein Q8P59_02670 [Dehalococcoidia bacterium]|nr:hypothetical protein [Dehalococcoidia bacterium]